MFQLIIFGWTFEILQLATRVGQVGGIGRYSLCFSVHTISRRSGHLLGLSEVSTLYLLWRWSIWVLVVAILCIISTIIALFLIDLLYWIMCIPLHVDFVTIICIISQYWIWSMLLWKLTVMLCIATTVWLTYVGATLVGWECGIVGCFSSVSLTIDYIFEYLQIFRVIIQQFEDFILSFFYHLHLLPVWATTTLFEWTIIDTFLIALIQPE